MVPDQGSQNRLLVDIEVAAPPAADTGRRVRVAPDGASISEVDRKRSGGGSVARRWLARAVVLWAACLALLAAGGMAPAAHAIDLKKPLAGITDPAAEMVPLAQDCAGQVDLNAASASALAEGLGISSGPTIDRIMKARPFLKAVPDLLSIPGVPVSARERLASDACAEPPVLPPDTPLACRTGSSAVDLQTAPVAVIEQRLRVPRKVAQGIVDARPLSQDLRHITAPAVPGLPDKKVDDWVNSGDACVTPAPFSITADGELQTWRFIYAAHGAVVESADGNGRFALVVPTGNVSGQTGAWGRVIVPEADAPELDAHIFGDWTGEVGLRLPTLETSKTPDPIIMHEVDSQTTSFSFGEGVASGPNGTTVSAARSLSTFVAGDRSDLCVDTGDAGSLLCSALSPRDSTLRYLADQAGVQVGRYVGRFPAPGPCEESFDLLRSSGSVLKGMGCSGDLVAPPINRAQWNLSNTTGFSKVGGVVTRFGAVLQSFPVGSSQYAEGEPVVDGGYGAVGRVLAKSMVKDFGLLLPGTTLPVTKSQGSGPSTFQHSAAGFRDQGEIWAGFQVLDTIDAMLTAANISDYSQFDFLSCVYKLSSTGGEDLDYGAFKDCVDGVANQLIDGFLSNDQLSARARGAFTFAKKALSRAAIVPVALDYASSYAVYADNGGNPQITLEYLSPPPPTPTAGGDGGGLAGDGTFIARTSSGAGYLVDTATATARHITGGNQFLACASNRLVWDFVEIYSSGGQEFLNLADQAKVIGDAADCPPPTVTWDYKPKAQGGNIPNNVLLRGGSGAEGGSWLINNLGQIQTITGATSGGIYTCLAASNPVVWAVPFSSIQAWQPVGTAPADCG